MKWPTVTVEVCRADVYAPAIEATPFGNDEAFVRGEVRYTVETLQGDTITVDRKTYGIVAHALMRVPTDTYDSTDTTTEEN